MGGKESVLQRRALELHSILVNEELAGLRDVIPYAQGIETCAWVAIFPIDDALNNLSHLVFLAIALAAVDLQQR